jgi:hypothetical protein
LDEVTYFFGDCRTSRLTVVTQASPVISESFVLPGDDGARLNEFEGLMPTKPKPREPGPQEAILGVSSCLHDTLSTIRP